MSFSGLDIAEVFLIIVVFVIGVGGFMYAALKDDDKK
jgi:hypothetical protein